MKRIALVAICAGIGLALGGALSANPDHVFGPFQHGPLDGPPVITGSFGEFRPGHFHAGLDYSTGGGIGLPVYAPLDGWIERVHTSGTGYGRSIYLHSQDGRLLVFGHLDAFDEPIASYVATAQDSSGQYEQDLWFEPGRMRVKAGQRLGWSGDSGIGSPHLHLEVRRGDMGINPLLAGATAEDHLTPVITRVALEPVGADSRVNGRAIPVHLRLGAHPESITIVGAARVIVDAKDPGERGSLMEPYEIEMRWANHHVTCRFDSVSWATDMPEDEYVYNRGVLAHRDRSVRMWAPAGVALRVISSDLPVSEPRGLLTPSPSADQNVEITASDLAGNKSTKSFVIRAGAAAAVPATTLPRAQQGSQSGFSWQIPADAFFEAADLNAEISPHLTGRALQHVGPTLSIGPAWVALRKSFVLRLSVPEITGSKSTLPRDVALYQDRGGGWDAISSRYDPTRQELIAEPNHLGRFALLRDVIPPHLASRRMVRLGPSEPYSKWRLECVVAEHGSGVDPRASYFTVDDRRVPSEFDSPKNVLRWKPLKRPAHGAHTFTVVVADRAGNVTRRSGRFVIN
jgi:murein DD-endopeptidase MepM/ murein hydrolase activator NlpD